MIPRLLGQTEQVRAVEVDAIEIDEVGILTGIHAAGGKPDLTTLVVDVIDASHEPGSLRDLVLELAVLPIVEVEVIPTIAFGGPNDLLALSRWRGIVL